MKKVIRLTESDLSNIIKRIIIESKNNLISEQGLVIKPKNIFIGIMVVDGLKSSNQTLNYQLNMVCAYIFIRHTIHPTSFQYFQSPLLKRYLFLSMKLQALL